MNAGREEENADGAGDTENKGTGRTVCQRITRMEAAVGAKETGKVIGQILLTGEPARWRIYL